MLRVCDRRDHALRPEQPLQHHPGKAVYEQYCAACHNLPATRAPALASLQQMSAQTLRFALTEGIMRQQGSAVLREQFQQLIGYLAAPETGGDWVAGMMCKPDQRAIDLSQPSRCRWSAPIPQQPAPERSTGGTRRARISAISSSRGPSRFRRPRHCAPPQRSSARRCSTRRRRRQSSALDTHAARA